MGVWSSISFCHLERKSGKTSYNPRNSNPKQILNVDSDSFSTTLLQDVKEFRIQESISENLTGTSLPETQIWPTNFEYSMGGNLKFYKKHLKQDHLGSKLPTVSYLRRQINISTSDNDSEPESLRYSRKSLMPSTVDIITEEREPELSFDNYSTIYQPEFLLNIRSQSLVKQTPNEIREAKQCEEITGTRKPSKENRTSKISVEKPIEKRKPKENKTDNISVKKPVEKRKPTLKSKRPAAANVIKEEEVFDYDAYTCRKEEENTRKDKYPLRQDDRQHGNELFIKEEELKTIGKKLETEKNKVIKKGKEKKFRRNTSVLATTDVVSGNVTENMAQDFSLSFNKHDNVVRDNTNWIEEINIRNKNNFVGETRKRATDFYPESPIAEVDFFKTPCSTRHNSLESLTDLENCGEETSEMEHYKKLKDHPSATSVQLQENYSKLPKEFQEMARRLSIKDELKSRPSLHQITSLQHFNCSSSTCSTNSPRSPSGKILSRTPSYKMPKTPSLSRQHPATYVTQHTSSRSRPSSRVSSRATSPTHENCEDSSIKDFIDSWKREARIQHNWVLKYKDTSPSKIKRTQNLCKTTQ